MKFDAFNIWKVHSSSNIKFDEYYNILINKIKASENFTFIRLCDGEYANLFETRSWDKQLNDDEVKTVATHLNNLISYKLADKDLENGLIFGNEHDTQYVRRFEKYFEIIHKLDEKCGKFPATLFSYMTVSDQMELFFEILNNLNRPIILVGPPHLENLELLKYTDHIKTDLKKSWQKQDQIESELNFVLNKYIEQQASPVILYACSVSGKIIMSKNYLEYGNKLTQIDIGANLDPYCDVFSRDWHQPIIDYYRQLRRKNKMRELREHGMPGSLLQSYSNEVDKPDTSYAYKDTAEYDKIGFESWFDPKYNNMFKHILSNDMLSVIEIGNWCGVSTKAIKENAPNAKIFVINEWNRDLAAYQQKYNAKLEKDRRRISEKLSILWENFIINCWNIKDSVYVLRTTPKIGLETLAEQDVFADAIYINSIIDSNDLTNILNYCKINWPEAVLFGDGYNDPYNEYAIKRSLNNFELKFKIKVKNKNNIWYINANNKP